MSLATGVAAYAGSYTVPANTITNPGSGSEYEIWAINDGDMLAQVTGLSLSATPAASASGTATASARSTQQEGTDTATGVPTASIESVGITTLTMSGTVTGSDATNSPAVNGTSSRTASSFVTSTTSRSGSGPSTSAAATTSEGSTNTANGQKRLGGGELVLSAAGMLAGIVALLA
ncbi:uncharacterized protein Z518_08092 [Rhinocladiella mackenziei CBS 650.93]|uniref:Rhinocladiella mackenziei CBS 650.93 unplaced genomic scaffold supercont1.6, whole genome shotgun sequence n=1 Tax=Rhinocladiella mackenziei CBS 650.93 TaxID=1442369 RepID=A0A0D2GV45_9EURO|nr:uncharacterized protein Z518_08092 [Rhinocladiella mackenziei CBS 650.93]KIX02153.1 hypothetical protein Z518_08092 [Rhinocladiella mackenziei CBS 650.93]